MSLVRGVWVFVAVIGALANGIARAEIVCPPMPGDPTKVGHNIKSDIEAKVGSLGKISAAEIAVKTEVTAKSLFDKFPNADRLAALQTMSSTYCSIIKDEAISPIERANRWENFQDKMLKLMTMNTSSTSKN